MPTPGFHMRGALNMAALLAVGIVSACASPAAPAQKSPGALTEAPTSGGEGVSIRIVEPSTTNAATWKFDPSTANARVGATVTWSNSGGAAHTVTANNGEFDSGDLGAPFRSRPGGIFSWTPTAAGSFPYFCTYHPWMTGTITVGAG